MEESVTALFAKISDKIHNWKQYWEHRKGNWLLLTLYISNYMILEFHNLQQAFVHPNHLKWGHLEATPFVDFPHAHLIQVSEMQVASVAEMFSYWMLKKVGESIYHFLLWLWFWFLLSISCQMLCEVPVQLLLDITTTDSWWQLSTIAATTWCKLSSFTELSVTPSLLTVTAEGPCTCWIRFNCCSSLSLQSSFFSTNICSWTNLIWTWAATSEKRGQTLPVRKSNISSVLATLAGMFPSASWKYSVVFILNIPAERYLRCCSPKVSQCHSSHLKKQHAEQSTQENILFSCSARLSQ